MNITRKTAPFYGKFRQQFRRSTLVEASFVVRVVRNGYGLHLRTANILAQKTNQFKSGIWFFEDGLDEDAKSIKGVTFLCAQCGTEVTVKARGEDAK